MRVILKRPRAADDLIELWDYIAEDRSRGRMRSSTMSTQNFISGQATHAWPQPGRTGSRVTKSSARPLSGLLRSDIRWHRARVEDFDYRARCSFDRIADEDEIRVSDYTFRFLLDDDEKPKKKEMGAARMAALMGAKAAEGAAPGSAGAQAAASSTITVKERVLQDGKKDAKGSAAGWDMSQMGDGMKWLMILGALARAAGIYFLIRRR